MANQHYTKMPNWLLENIAESDLLASDIKVLLYIIRMTLGYQKKSDKLSGSDIAKATDLSRSTVIRSLDRLKAAGWISVRTKKSKTNFYETNLITLKGSVTCDTTGSVTCEQNSVSPVTHIPLKAKDKPLSSGRLEAPLSGKENNRLEEYRKMMEEVNDDE